jgi:hypothetical protein
MSGRGAAWIANQRVNGSAVRRFTEPSALAPGRLLEGATMLAAGLAGSPDVGT